MIQDIQMTGFSFLDAPFIPMDTIRVFHLFYVFDGTGVLIADSSSYPCGRDSLFVFPSLEVAVPQPSLRSVLTILHVSFTCASPLHGAGVVPSAPPYSRCPRKPQPSHGTAS